MLTRGGLGKRAPAVGATFPFAELPEALDFLRSGASLLMLLQLRDEVHQHNVLISSELERKGEDRAFGACSTM